MAYSAVLVFFLVVAVSHAHAKLSIDPSDLESLKTVQRELGLGIVLQRASVSTMNPCNSMPGLICERRLSTNNSYVLRVTRLVFVSRRLEGSISPAVGRLTELKELSLANNNLFGQLPSQLVNCKKLEILNLRNNLFTGEIPMEISSLVRLRELDLASNRFKGELSFLKHLPNIEKLNLSNNLFRGKVPASVRSFHNLRYFDASGNDFLKGPVLSLNDLDRPSSRIPRRFALAGALGPRSNTTSVPTTPAPMDSTFSPTIAPAPAVTPRPHKRWRSVVRKVAIGIFGFLIGGVTGTICGFVCCLLFKKILSLIRGEEKDAGPSIYSPLIKKADDLAFLEKEDALQSLEVIGRGGCGIVYKTELPGSNGKIIAIKKITQPAKDAAELTEEDSRALNRKMRQIRTEIRIMGEIRHKNLLPLLAHLSRPDCHYLVYEYMKNGSLQDLLEKVSQGKTELDWLTRHSIALGVVAGLEYLHFNHHKKVIHRDLKPANVLLDDDMEVRIADFGLAKEMKEEDTHATSTNVVGTVGYIAPEYYSTNKFTERSDMYSFGVLLASLVTGKLPSDNFFENIPEMGIVTWLRRVMESKNQKEAIDEKLMGNGYEEQMLLVLKVAYFCTREDPKNRPNSKDVRCMLEQIKH